MPRNTIIRSSVKHHGRIYTPDYIVSCMLDLGGYAGQGILRRHVMDNSCGDGAFLEQIVRRYCRTATQAGKTDDLKQALENHVHGIELDAHEHGRCLERLDAAAAQFGVTAVRWDIRCADTLKDSDAFDGQMDFVFGNPPYVRIHNLQNHYECVKQFQFAKQGMTDLYIAFFEIGFRMLSPEGALCLITPSSWMFSNAGKTLRQTVTTRGILKAVVDLEHFQPFRAATYTVISCFKGKGGLPAADYYTFDTEELAPKYADTLSYTEFDFDTRYYFGTKTQLSLLREIFHQDSPPDPAVTVKNGFATLADPIFIGDRTFDSCCIDVVKASTGRRTRCVFPYTAEGKPLSWEEVARDARLARYLNRHKSRLLRRSIANPSEWFLFGRSQALADVARPKLAVNTLIKDRASVKVTFAPEGCGVYGGLYVLTDRPFRDVQNALETEDFVDYVHALRHYKSGGYCALSSRELQQFLNARLRA